MKRGLIILIAVCLIPALAAAEDVTTQNAAGMIQINLQKDKFTLMCLNIDIPDGDYSISNVLDATQLPGGTTVYLWDEDQQEYQLDTPEVEAIGEHVWNPGTNIIQKGMSFWIKPTSNCTLTVYGEAPMDPDASVNLFGGGFSFVSYSFPAEIDLTNCSLNDIVQNGDTLYYWDNGWHSIWRSHGKWDTTNYVLQAGKGIIYKSFASTNRTWTEDKPYIWP